MTNLIKKIVRHFKKGKEGKEEYSNLTPEGILIRYMKVISPKIPYVGKNTYSARDLKVRSKYTRIGSFCSIGEGVKLGLGDHPLSYLSTSSYFYFTNLKWKNEDMPSHDEFWIPAPIIIGNDVWIGDNVTVKNGVTIGDGAIIGANALVTKDVPHYAIVGGVPAKIIRYRFDENTIKELLELKWWELDDEILKRVPYDNIDKALTFLKEIRKK